MIKWVVFVSVRVSVSVFVLIWVVFLSIWVKSVQNTGFCTLSVHCNVLCSKSLDANFAKSSEVLRVTTCKRGIWCLDSEF